MTLTRHDVYTADECFLTGTAAEVIPVVKCDGRVIGPASRGRSRGSCANASTRRFARARTAGSSSSSTFNG